MMRLSTVASFAVFAVLAGCGFFTPEDNSLGPNNTIKLNAADSAVAVQFLKSINNWGGNFGNQIIVSDSGYVIGLRIDNWKGGTLSFPVNGMEKLQSIRLYRGCTAKKIKFTGLGRYENLSDAIFDCPDLAAWPEGLLDNKRWREFKFHSGSIDSLPDGMLQLDSLGSLYMIHQNISKIPEGLWRLPKLGKVWPYVGLDENKLCSVSDSTRQWLNRVNQSWETNQRCP